VYIGTKIPVEMGLPWEFDGNGNSFWATNANGNNAMGMGMAHM